MGSRSLARRGFGSGAGGDADFFGRGILSSVRDDEAGAWMCASLCILLGCGAPVDAPLARGSTGSAGPPAACPMAELVATVASLGGLAADNERVYWMDGGRVLTAPAPFPALHSVLMDVGNDGPEATGNRLTLDAAHVYASGADGIFRVDKQAQGMPQNLGPPVARAHALAVTATDLFVGRQSWVSDGGSLFRISLSGGQPALLHSEGYIWDVSHEALLVQWGTLRAWVAEARSRRLAPIGSVKLGPVEVR